MKHDDRVKAEDLVAAAATWRLASLLLERPRPEWHREIAKLSLEVREQELSSAAGAAHNATEEVYHTLFGPGGSVSPREASYCGFEDPAGVMARLTTFYRAFSFQPRREEPIDHIAVEAGFVGYLFLKQAYAQIRDDLESAAVTEEARRRFVSDHIQRCARGMIERAGEMPGYVGIVLSWLAEDNGAPTAHTAAS
jgi:nitrate reductase assembly molybdenum cofactor insertion protein NarJ